MSAHDRPFPPEGLPPDETKLFRMAYELAYRNHHVVEKGSVDGQGFIRAVRKVGGLEIDVEFHITVPQNLIRWWIWIWYDGRIVFNAWSAKAPERPGIGIVETCLDGPWKHFLRTRHELERR
ncbi:MAG TPA: hypothetical protein VJ694_02765 [Patescibacteria group bacterium]|nr:hypothetical protein [Patescibacteria group bacterium]